MMRLFRSIRSIPGFALKGGLCTLLVASPPRHAAAQVESDSGGALRLPLPVEEIESPERLDERPRSEAALSVQVAIRDGGVAGSGASVAAGRGAWSAGGTVWREHRARAWSATGEIHAGQAGLDLVLGRMDVHGLGALFGERIEMASRGSRIPSARAAMPEFRPPGGARSSGLTGVALARPARSGPGGAGLWALAGRWSEGAGDAGSGGLGAMGTVFTIGPSTIAPALGLRGGLVTGSVAARTRADAWDAGVEAVASRAGFSALVDAGATVAPLRWRGRWRFRGGDARPIGGEVSAGASSRLARIVLRVSGGASGTTGAVERRELEGRIGTRQGLGPLSLRLGSTGTTGFTRAAGFTERRERYAVIDLEVARGSGRAFSVLATRRERETGSGLRAGTSAGGRLDLVWRRRGRLEIRVEAVRAEPGAAAWSSGIHASGAASLRTRTRPGIAASARGEAGAGDWRLGGVVEGREDELGRQAAAATIWIERRIPFITRGIDTR